MNRNHLTTTPNFLIHPAHHEEMVKHAVRHIPGADKIVKEWMDQKYGFHKPRPDDDRQDHDDSRKDHLS
jgi:hypothetical protein